MLAYVTCATDSLEPRERKELFDALALVPESVDPEGSSGPPRRKPA